MEKILKFLKEEDGVTALEYALIASLIAVFIIAAVQLAGTKVSSTFNKIATSFTG